MLRPKRELKTGLSGWHFKAKGQIPEIWPFLKWFGMKKWCLAVRHSLAFLAFFDGVGMIKHWHYLKSTTHLLLSAWNYRTFSQDKGPLFSITVPFSKMQVALPSK